jgi:hypothetical protein
MTNITGGLVSIEDGKKAAEEFAPARKVRIELKFDIPEGDETERVLDAVIALAQSRVASTIAGTKAKAPTAAPKPVEPKPDAPATGKTKADLEAEMLAAASKPKKPPSAAAKPKDDEVLGSEPTVVEAEKPAEDSLDDVLGDPAPAKDITDADLTSAITKKNAEIKAPAKIRDLITKYTPEGKAPSAALIPKEKRSEFLDGLSKLTA